MTPKRRQLPKNCEIKDGSIRYRHRIPLAERANTALVHDKQGRMPPVRLCAADAPDHILHASLAAVQESLLHQADDQYLTLGWLHQQWLNHKPTPASSTKAYQGCKKSLMNDTNLRTAFSFFLLIFKPPAD